LSFAHLQLTGRDSSVLLGSGSSSPVKVFATCGGENASFTAVYPQNLSLATKKISVQLGNVAPSCAVVSSFRTPCAANSALPETLQRLL
jgi:hypothetical protein